MDGVFGTITTATARESGVTRGALRGREWQKRSHGLYRPAGQAVSPGDGLVADALALLGDGGVLGGWAALRAQGNLWFDGVRGGGQRRPMVHCRPGSQLRVRSCVQPFRGALYGHEFAELEGFAMATMARAAYDEMRLAPSVRSAVKIADMAVSRVHDWPHTSLDALGSVIGSHHKTRGLVQARRAFSLACDRSASSLETTTRLIAVLDADLSGLLVNVPIFDGEGVLLGVADLLEPQSGLILETDGAHHREAAQHADDNVREESYERAGLVVVRVSALDHGDVPRLVRRIVLGLRDARLSSRRDWTLARPDWWSTWPPGRRWD